MSISLIIAGLVIAMACGIIDCVLMAVRERRNKGTPEWHQVFRGVWTSILWLCSLNHVFLYYKPLFSIFGIGPQHILYVSWPLSMVAGITSVLLKLKYESRPGRFCRAIIIGGFVLLFIAGGWLIVEAVCKLAGA